MLNNTLGFKRQFYVKDLMNFNSFVTGASLVEFATFQDFAKVFLRDKKLHLKNVFKIIIPVETAEEAELVSLVDPNALPFIIIYLKNFSKEVRDKFTNTEKKALIVDSSRVLEFKNELLSDSSPIFLKFLQNTYGYFRNKIAAKEREKLTEIYTDPFFIFPYFCIADVQWDWETFEDLKVSEFESVQYFLNVLQHNMIKRVGSIDWKKFKASEIGESKYTWDFLKVESPKRIFIQDGFMYINSPVNTSSKIDLYTDIVDGNQIPFKELDFLRHQYDVKFTERCGITNTFLIRIEDNVKIMKNAAMIPSSTYLVDHILTNGRV